MSLFLLPLCVLDFSPFLDSFSDFLIHGIDDKFQRRTMNVFDFFDRGARKNDPVALNASDARSVASGEPGRMVPCLDEQITPFVRRSSIQFEWNRVQCVDVIARSSSTAPPSSNEVNSTCCP